MGVLVVLILLFFLLGTTIPYARTVTLSPESRAQLDSLEYTADRVGPDRVTLIEETSEAYGVRVQLIRAAQKTLDIVYYTMDGAASTDAFLGEVIAAADRGVLVRILTDSKMGPAGSAARGLKAAAAHENITWRVYNPLNLLLPWTWQSSLHDKFLTVDGTYLLLGGRNIGDRFFDPEGYTGSVTNDRDVLVWQAGAETGVLAQAAAYTETLWASDDVVEQRAAHLDRDALDELQAASRTFAADNPRSFTTTLAQYLDRTVETNRITLLSNPIHTAKKEPWVAYGLYQMARTAREEIWIQSPYATGNTALLEALSDLGAAQPVTYLTNSLASSPNYPAFSNYYANRGKFLDTGMSIHEYQSPGSIHAKAVVIDGRLTAVGTLNLDDRSMHLDTETMLVIDSAAFGRELLEALGEIRDHSLEVAADGSYLPSETAQEADVSFFRWGLMWVVSLLSRPLQFLV